MDVGAVFALIVLILIVAVIVLLVAVLRKRSADADRTPFLKQIETLERGQERSARELRGEIAHSREEFNSQAGSLRTEVSASVQRIGDSVTGQMSNLMGLQTKQSEGFAVQLNRLTDSNENKLDSLRTVVETKLAEIKFDNNAKLEEMRRTVDEKLEVTLGRRSEEHTSELPVTLESRIACCG